MVPSTRATLQVTSAFLETFWGKMRLGLKKSKKSQKQPELKVIIHAFGLSRSSSSERHGMPPRAMGGHCIGKQSCGLERIYVQFDAILGFTRNEQMGVFRGYIFEAMQMVPRTHTMTQRYKSHWHSQECFGIKYDQARKSPKMYQKQPKLKVIIHAF